MTLRLIVYAWVATVAAAPASAWAGAPAYQGSLPAEVNGPRAVASTPGGDVFVVDAQGALQRLTRQGDRVGTLLTNATSVAFGDGVVFAGTRDGAVAAVNPTTGRVLRKFKLGTSEAPSAMAYDEARGKLWLAFASGVVQARAADGTRLHDIPPGASGVARLSSVAVDGAGTVWVFQDRTENSGGTLRSYDAQTGALRGAVPAAVRIAGGISVGPGGELYVPDLFSGNVQVLGKDGASTATVGRYGTAAGELTQPSAVGFLGNGDLVVADMAMNRLQRYGGGAGLPTCAGDADCDGLPDEWEIANGLDAHRAGDALSDFDGDGLNNAEELALGTNPRSRDTDGDGYSDAEEVASGFDPRDATDHKPRVMVDGPRTTDPGYVRLSATARDPLGSGVCTVQWRQTSGAPVVLKSAATASPSFVARAAGTYGFEATGSCGGVTAIPGQIAVAVRNVAPRADGGRVVTLAAGGQLQLSGEFTSDANGEPLAFQWDQLFGPPVSGSVAGRELAATLPAAGYYVFRLAAVDAAEAEGAAEVPVLVLGEAAAPTAVVSTPVRARAGESVTLDASASYRGAGAAFSWRQVEGAPVALEAAAERASFVAPQAGRYAFEVGIEEAGLRSPPGRIEVYAAVSGGELPVARVAAPAVAAVDAPVTLDGTGSAGAGPLSYAWRQSAGPAAGLTRVDRAAAMVVLFEPGSYEFELAVSGAGGTSVPARVRVEGRARGAAIPVAVATAAATALAGDLVLLDGRASTAAQRYRWTQVEGPWVRVEQGAVGSFRPAAAGLYGFELEVDDGAVRSAPFRVNVVVF